MKYLDIKNILETLTDPVEKLEMVMDIGKYILPIPKTAVCAQIDGCASIVQICQDGNKFYGMADSALVRGIVVIMLAMVEGVMPDDIKKMNLHDEFLSLGISLGAGRMNGVNSMIRFFESL